MQCPESSRSIIMALNRPSYRNSYSDLFPQFVLRWMVKVISTWSRPYLFCFYYSCYQRWHLQSYIHLSVPAVSFRSSVELVSASYVTMNSYRHRRCGKYALQGAVQSHHFDVQSSDVDVTEYLRDNEADIISRLGEALDLHRRIKWYGTMDIAFYRTTPDGEIQNTTGRFRTQPAILSDASELFVKSMINDFLHALEAFNRHGSRWLVDYILDFSITLAPFRPAQGSSYIPTPTHIAAKKCVVNIQNLDEQLCFLYSILAQSSRLFA